MADDDLYDEFGNYIGEIDDRYLFDDYGNYFGPEIEPEFDDEMEDEDLQDNQSQGDGSDDELVPTETVTMNGISLNIDSTRHILAWTERRYYPVLKGVCKEFYKLLTSTKFPTYRIKFGNPEPMVLIYVDRQWFCIRLTSYAGFERLRPFPINPSQDMLSILTLDHKIIVVERCLRNKLFTRLINCATMKECSVEISEANVSPSLGLINGTIFVVGLGQESRCYSSPLEPLKWKAIDLQQPPPDLDRSLTSSKGLVMCGKMLINKGGRSLVFDPTDGSLKYEDSLDTHWIGESSCVINDYLFSVSKEDRRIRVYHDYTWRLLVLGPLGGIDQLYEDFTMAKLVNFGGNLLVVYKNGKQMWGREIKIRLQGEEIVGETLWGSLLLKKKDTFTIDEAVCVNI